MKIEIKKCLCLILIFVSIIFTSCYIPKNGVVIDQNGTRYYQNDIYQTGWIYIDGNEHYFSMIDGYMLTQSSYIEGKWWGIDSDGKKASGFLKDTDGVRYYIDGEYITGWQVIDGNKYYFKKESGLMITGEATVGGEIFVFSGNGILLEDE